MTSRPVIVIPGLKGTGLESIYTVPPNTTWSAAEAFEQSLVGPDFDQLALDDAGESDESEQVVNRASQVLALAYGSLVSALRGRLGPLVYVFPYDWRYSITRSAQSLVRYVQRLQHKLNQLQRQAPAALSAWDQKFDFACHSMGGLVLRAFLAAWPDGNRPVGRVVFIATPHQGSLDAIEAMTRGETVIFGGRKSLRKMARTFPGVYDLLPRFDGAVVAQAGAALDIFDIGNWQKNVSPGDDDDYHVVSQHLIDARERLNALPLPVAHGINDVLVIYGLEEQSTLTKVTVLPEKDGVENWYDFDRAERGAGDHVVPTVSAQLAGVPAVEIHKDDISYFDIKARLLSMHAVLPSLDEVQNATARFFQGKSGIDLLSWGMDNIRYKPPA